jgi:excisionase family DNA binding protein
MNADVAPNPRPRYLTTEEAAEFLRLSARTLEKHRSTGVGPRYRKFGRRVCYTIADLEAWAEARNFAMTSDPDYPDLYVGVRGQRRRRKPR